MGLTVSVAANGFLFLENANTEELGWVASYADVVSRVFQRAIQLKIFRLCVGGKQGRRRCLDCYQNIIR